MNTNRQKSARVHSPLPIGKLGVGCDYSYPIFFSRHFISFQLNPHFGEGFFVGSVVGRDSTRINILKNQQLIMDWRRTIKGYLK